tara:strand:+ start:202 stop:375 length:174 start_codon:yes stop_codon:yes gene_type:complete
VNEKQVDKRIAELKAFTKGQMPIVQLVKTEKDKLLWLQRLKGKKGVKNIEVKIKEEK